MNHRRRRQFKGLTEINVVPYIDVMLVLLVILLATAPLLNQGVQVQLPQAQAQSLPVDDKIPLIVTVDNQGNCYFNKAVNPTQPLKAQALVTEIAAQLKWAGESRPKVLVKGDKHVSYGKVMAAMVLLQQAGVPTVGLMTTPT